MRGAGNHTPEGDFMAQPVILVAEDEAGIREVVAEFLSDSGFNVVEAPDAASALSLIQSQQVDLVFSDINMPGAMQGDSLADWLSTHRPTLPVILTSGVEKPTLRGRARRFIRKPYLLLEVEHQIRELLH
jgi:two-component system, response regulator PdtaR